MNEQQAEKVAKVLGGSTWQSGGDIWLVLINRADGKLVVLSDEAICEYSDQNAFDNGQPSASIYLA